MAAPLTDSRPFASPVQYSAHEDLPATEVPRTDSFVGLPPIRRTSTFGPLGDKNGQSDDGESADADSYRAGVQDVIPPVPAIPSGMMQSAKGQHDSAQYSQVSHQQSQGPAAQYNPHEGHLVNGQKGYHLPNGAYPPAPGRNGAPVQFPGIPVSQFSQYNMNMQGRNGFPSPTGLPGIQTGMQSSSAQPAVRPGAASPPSAGGNPIHRFPPQGQWKLEESQLSEPLNTSRKTQTPPAQQTGYYAGDKETESLVPVGGPSQLPQRNPRNNSQPPVAAQRFPGLFPAGSSNQSPVHQDHIQMAPAAQQAQQHRRDSMGVSRSPTRDLEDDNKRQQSLLTQIGGKIMPTRARPDSISKDGFQADEVSVSETSIITEDEPERKHKRASFFGMGNSGNTGAQSQPGHVDTAPQQFQNSGPGEKKKTFFGASGLAKQMTGMGGGKTDNASGGSDTNSNPGSGAKKRLSEFRSIFKSGPKDDAQPNKTERPTSGRPSMQSSIRPSTEDQGFHTGQTQPNAQLGMMAPPPINRGRSSTQGSVQGTPMGLPPNMGQLRPQHTGDGPEKRAPNGALASAGGFLGNLLGNKPGSSAKDPTNPQISQMGQPGYGPMSMGGQQPQRGQFAPSSYQHPQQMGPHGQPNYPPGQLQALNNRMRQMSNPGVPQQHLSPGQPSGPPQQKLQDQTRALNHDARGALDPNRITPTGEHQRILAAPANDDSPRSSQEFLRVNRKPVGSGSSRLASGSMIAPPAATSSQPPSKSEVEPSRTPEPSNEFGGDGQRPSEIYQSHQSSHLGASTQAGHIRQPSLPTPSQSPAPPPGSPGANRISAQSGQSSLSPYVQQQGFNDAAQIGQPKTVSGTNGGSMPFQPFPGQQVPGMQGPPGHAGPGQQPPLQGPGRLSPQPTQPWGFTRTATQPPMGPASSGQHQQMYPGQAGGAAGSVQEQKGTMSKLFGAGRKRNSTSPQPPIGGFPMQTKEKESTSSKLLGAFKRSSKQQDSSKMQQPVLPQAQRISGRAEAPDQPIQPAQPVQANQIGQPGQHSGQPDQSSQAMPLYMTPARRGQSPAPGPMPQGSLGASGQPPRASPGLAQPAQFNRGQASPPMPGDRGQLPSQTTRVGHGQISPAVLPMMQSNRSQAQAPRSEPQYAAVPIPRGYEAVHGYGVPNMLAHSPYFVGRGSPPQHFGTQFQPLVPQYSGASQQFQPVMPQHTGSSQHVQQMVPQPTGNNPADPQRPSPTPSQQTQSAPGQPQNQIPPHSGVAANSEQGNQLLRVDDHAPPQQFMTRQGGSPDSHQQVPAAQESSARNSPQPAPGGDAFLSPPSHENLQQRPSAQDQIVAPVTRNDDAQAPRTQPQQILTSMGQLEMPRNASPQNQPLPDSATTFSPVNAATGRLSDPPLPPVTSIYNGDQQSVHNASHTPSPPMGAQSAGRFGLHHMTSSQSVAEDARHQSYGRDVDPHRHFNVSPEPPRSFSVPAQQLSNPNLIVNVNKANSHSSDRDDLYDATPRNSHPSQPQQVPMQEPVLQHPDEPARHDGYGAAMAGGAVAGVFAGDVTSSTISRTSSIQAEPSQLVAPAQAAPMEPEEKILVDQPVELAAVNDDDDGMPMMSATSYPGQEWNPYGAGEFGDFD
ncbi:hypothetical protein PFICI_07056 [Pestalotiopsis fici W106-1]|uniref:Uncharacterized protein n=1 Tax=Pestalotiopsis fici (strain W106-1 / CGMCC3.15140) TaxID=1229662 RepID=W3X7Q1_PESFW|nr:uncharacterized protein PFICI_07056 [Pestalotiopsis fici W106-1]ETS82054.1 hypothetical protein PFICI_07056 [Pestalotiopsis fici W106-1]